MRLDAELSPCVLALLAAGLEIDAGVGPRRIDGATVVSAETSAGLVVPAGKQGEKGAA